MNTQGRFAAMPSPGPLNLITDVHAELQVGHATDEHVATGVTVLACRSGWRAAVDVRGGGPGSRETDALAAENLVGRAHAVVLTGGSVFGLGAADGVAARLSAQGCGLKLAPEGKAIPIVPAAVLHDLANDGDKAWGEEPPYRRLGMQALDGCARAFALGALGAGRGAMAGVRKGGIGSCSLALEGGVVVGALVATNPIGSVVMADGRTPWAWALEIGAEFGGRRPDAATLAAQEAQAALPLPAHGRLPRPEAAQAGVNTTIAVVACNADLSCAELKRVAMMAHDGLARAVRPAHTPFDGDTVFALAPGEDGGGPSEALGARARLGAPGLARALRLAEIGAAAADCLARAIARGVHAAGAF
jgi:L-aminopeptidase/D-esterase-like protein